MNSRAKKILLVLLAAGLLVGVFFVQRAMNRDRERLGLTRAEPLENAPPVLAFTTVALGGFRGLIANALWIRANNLQEEDKFFEAAQLADWITKLEPHFVQVWIFQEWNMAWNISVKFKDFDDRWRWVQRGITLLRDEGLKYNPNEVLLYRELAWIFQNKIGANLDDASWHYKRAWFEEMTKVLGPSRPNYNELLNPQTDEAKARAQTLREKYKLEPAFMKQVDDLHGPLEWRLPEAHAIYWAEKGLAKAKENPTKVKGEELIQLHRVIYQSMQLTLYRGRLVAGKFDFGPNLEIIRKASDAYQQAMEEDAENRNNISRAYRNVLRDAVYFLYQYNRTREAAEWYKFLSAKFPGDPILEGKPDSLPATLTLEEYCVARVQLDINETNRDKVKAAIEGRLADSYYNLAIGEDDRAAGFRRLARVVWEAYQRKIPAERQAATGQPPFEDIDKEVRDSLLDPQGIASPEFRAILRNKLGMKPEETPTPAPTNAPSPTVTTTNAQPAEAH